MTETKQSKFEDVCNIDCAQYIEQKNKLNYLSWANAWREFKKIYPEAKYTVHKNESNLPYFKDEAVGYMVYTDVTVDGLTHEMWLPVLDYKNQTVLKPNMFQINTSVMRCLTKNLAMFGLGLYIYAGEDLPEGEEQPKTIDEKLTKVFEPPAKNLDRAAQEQMHATALNLLGACATLERLQSVWSENGKKWAKLDQDLFADIEQKKNECKLDITRENNQRNGDLV